MPEDVLELTGQRILITGGLGFIGSNIAHRCVELGATVTIYDSLDPQCGGNIYNIHGIRDAVEVIHADIRDTDTLGRCIADKHVTFHCAAYTSHPNSMKEPLLDIDVNCKGTVSLLEAARRFNADGKIVHVGTSTQVGPMQYTPVDERHPEFPADIYSANKTASEKYMLVYARAHGLRASVVRLANVFGPRSHIRTANFGFVHYFIGLGLQGKEITVFGDGSQLRSITYVDDCVDALLSAAAHEAAQGEVFFAVADRQHSVADIASQIVEHVGGALRFIPWPPERRAIEIGDAVISHEKITRLLGWTASHDLATGLRKTKQYYDACLEQYL